MRKLLPTTLLITAFLVPGLVHAQSEATIDTLLAHSKMGSQLGGMDESFERKVRQIKLPLDSIEQEKLIERGTAAFDSTELVGYVRSYFAKHYQDDLAADAAKGLQADFVKRIDSLSRDDVEPEDLKKYAQKLRTNPPARERRQLIQRMSKSQRATEFYVNNAMGIRGAVIDAAERMSGNTVADQALPDSSQIRRRARNAAVVSFLYTYEQVPQERLSKYVDFYESEAGQWYVGTYSQAINYAIQQASEALGKEIRKSN